MRVVLDTNVPASGFRTYGHGTTPPPLLLDAWRRQQFDLVVSQPILDELSRVFQTRYFSRRLTTAQIARALRLLQTDAIQTAITVSVQGVASHPEDDLVLTIALSAGADYLVTGDGQLLRLGSYQRVTIIGPREMLQRLAPP